MTQDQHTVLLKFAEYFRTVASRCQKLDCPVFLGTKNKSGECCTKLSTSAIHHILKKVGLEGGITSRPVTTRRLRRSQITAFCMEHPDEKSRENIADLARHSVRTGKRYYDMNIALKRKVWVMEKLQRLREVGVRLPEGRSYAEASAAVSLQVDDLLGSEEDEDAPAQILEDEEEEEVLPATSRKPSAGGVEGAEDLQQERRDDETGDGASEVSSLPWSLSTITTRTAKRTKLSAVDEAGAEDLQQERRDDETGDGASEVSSLPWSLSTQESAQRGTDTAQAGSGSTQPQQVTTEQELEEGGEPEVLPPASSLSTTEGAIATEKDDAVEKAGSTFKEPFTILTECPNFMKECQKLRKEMGGKRILWNQMRGLLIRKNKNYAKYTAKEMSLAHKKAKRAMIIK